MAHLGEILTGRPRPSPLLSFYSDYRLVDTLTYSQIRGRAEETASQLLARGVHKKPVLILARPTSSFVIEFFSLVFSGNWAVPLAPQHMMPHLDYDEHVRKILDVTGADLILGGKIQIPGISNLQCLTLQDLEGDAEHGRIFRPETGDVALIQFSSGSTSDPRGVILTHGNLLANLAQIKEGMAVTEDDILASWLPFYHDMGLIGGLFAALYNNVPAHFMEPGDFVVAPHRFLEMAGKTGTTIMMGPDFSYRMCARKISSEQKKKINLSSVRLALSGAEPVSDTTCLAFNQAFASCGLRPSALFPVYGLAEMSLAAAFSTLNQPYHVKSFDGEALVKGRAQPPDVNRAPVNLVSSGRPLRGVEVMMADGAGVPVSEGYIGRILLKSPSMTQGYFKDPEATWNLFSNGWLKTGDMGFLQDGELFILGREKDVIKINGKTFHPSDLEKKLARLGKLGIGRIAAFSSYDPQLQKEEVRVAVESGVVFPWRRGRIRKEILKRLLGVVPVESKNIFVLPPCAIPRTSSGKTKRFELKILLEQGALELSQRNFLGGLIEHRLRVFGLFVAYKFRSLTERLGHIQWRRPKTDPHEELKKYLTRLLAELSQTPKGEIYSGTPFHEYKIDSLALMSLTSRLEKDIVGLPLTDFIEKNSIDSLSHHILTVYPDNVNSWLAKRDHG